MQLGECLVRREIGIHDRSDDLIGTVHDVRRGYDPHSADLGIEPDERRQVRLVVLERVDMGSRSLFDEVFV